MLVHDEQLKNVVYGLRTTYHRSRKFVLAKGFKAYAKVSNKEHERMHS